MKIKGKIDHFTDYDRRKKTLLNRLRRFINNYWLIPVFTIYLELFAIVLPPMDSPIKNLTERNLNFLKGPVVFYHLVATDFPYTFMGHLKEIAIINKYTFNIDQISQEEIIRALSDKESVSRIYRRVIESRTYENTEIGGIVTLIYDNNKPKLRLYEITSLNKVFSEKLHKHETSPIDEFISFIQEQDSKEMLDKVGFDENITKNLIKVLLSNKPDAHSKMNLIKGFIKAYDIHSESKFILSPYDFKSALGSSKIEGKYLGLFHFHNNYMEPPSELDIANSSRDRQLVITLGDRGIVLYDLIKGREILYRGDLLS